ncbi:hypothetical protein [Phytohabitans houttuyneae]|nr:hypothetical protein [Phytohabitans houttuyneae]
MVEAVGTKDRVARLCRRYGSGELDGYIAAAGGTEILSRIRAAVAAGEGETLAADLDALDDAVAAVGLDGLSTPVRVLPKVPGTTGYPVLDTEVCPHGVCSRVEPPDGSPARRCAISGEPLRRLRLRT